MSDEQLKARDYILSEEKLPPQYNLVIINASSETAINLRGKIDAIIINSREEETIIQARGRYRNDLKTLYLLNSFSVGSIPSEFLNVKLFSEDKQRLCETIKLRNNQGRILKWTAVKTKIIEVGYYVEEGRSKNKRYSIIKK